jgi:hypothetical protein
MFCMGSHRTVLIRKSVKYTFLSESEYMGKAVPGAKYNVKVISLHSMMELTRSQDALFTKRQTRKTIGSLKSAPLLM